MKWVEERKRGTVVKHDYVVILAWLGFSSLFNILDYDDYLRTVLEFVLFFRFTLKTGLQASLLLCNSFLLFVFTTELNYIALYT